MKHLSLLPSRGISLVETMIAVAVLGTVAGIGFFAASKTHKDAKRVKLDSNVTSLNLAVTSYLAQGGDLSGSQTAAEVIHGLRMEASNSSRIAGFKGSFLDARLEVVAMDSAAAGTSQDRVIWNNAAKRFVVSQTGTNAIADFRLNDALAATVTSETETREAPMSLAATSQWVWDFQDSGITRTTLDDVPTNEVADTATAADPTAKVILSRPTFSVTGDLRPLSDFPLELTLTHGNSQSGTTIKYAVDGGAWQDYTGTINVQPDQEIAAYVSGGGQGNLFDSSVRAELYLAEPAPDEFAGSASGEFVNPTGAVNMVASTCGDSFSWGTPDEFSQSSSLQFAGSSFANVAAGAYFQLGSLYFYNGSILVDTGATHVSLALDLALSGGSNQDFTFELDLLNTENIETQTADENADYVWLLNPSVNFSTTLNGNNYALHLSFGYFGSEGFANVSQFHVHEGADATAALYGQFILAE